MRGAGCQGDSTHRQARRNDSGKAEGLAVQRDQLETTLAQLGSCLHFMRESVRTGNERDSLVMKTNTVRQVKELTTPFQPDMLKPNATKVAQIVKS